ncbi:MAG: ZIP family metal transporter [Candidatus Bathyarchaeia archaeon]
MTVLLWILGCTLFISLLSFVGVFSLGIKDKLLKSVLFSLVGFSAGALIGGAFLHLLPEALTNSDSVPTFLYLIVGFTIFFLLEKILYWRHCHDGKCPIHMFTYLNLIGDGVHNFLDGLIISVSFLTSLPLGLASTFAVAAHEIPQELGDFGVLVYGGFTKLKALLYNFSSALTAIAGALMGYFLNTYVEDVTSPLIPFAAGGFLYIAASDLIPELHKQPDFKKSISSFTLFLVGLGFMGLMKLFID